MTRYQKTGGGGGGNKLGRPWLKNAAIVDGETATIDVEPWQEEADFGDGAKMVLRVPLKLDNAVRDEYTESDVTEVVWTPGIFAEQALIDAHPDSDLSVYVGEKGYFDRSFQWKSKTRSGTGTAFILGNGSSVTEHPKGKAPATKGAQTRTSSKTSTTSSPARGNFRCTNPGCNVSTTTMADLKTHFATHAPQ